MSESQFLTIESFSGLLYIRTKYTNEYFSDFALFYFALYNFHNSALLLYVAQILCVNLWMILIQWLNFLFLIFSFLSTNKIFLTIQFKLRFRISYLRSSYDNFKNILSSSSFLFFPSSFSFSFIFFLIPICSFIFPHFPLFFSQFASFPQFGLPFPKSAAPVLPHFLLPWAAVS